MKVIADIQPEVDFIKGSFDERIKKLLDQDCQKNIKIPKLKRNYYSVFMVNGKIIMLYFVFDKYDNKAYNDNLFRCHERIRDMEKLALGKKIKDIDNYYVVFISGNKATCSRPPHREKAKVYMDALRFIDGSIHKADKYKLEDKNENIIKEVILENSYVIEWCDIKNNPKYKFVLFEIKG